MHTVVNGDNIKYAQNNNGVLADCLITDPYFPTEYDSTQPIDLAYYTDFTRQWLSAYIDKISNGSYLAIHQPAWTLHYCTQAMLDLDIFIKDYVVAVKQDVNFAHRSTKFTLFPGRDTALNSAATFWVIGQKRADTNNRVQVPATYNLSFLDETPAMHNNCIVSDSNANSRRMFHPSQQPANVVSYLVNLLSYPGMTIIDPFAGGGEVAVSASKFTRNSISVDLSRVHCNTILSRLPKQYTTFIQL